MSQTLSARQIIAGCPAAAQHVCVEIVAETGSTNADLLGRIHHLAGPTLLLAEVQTAGRGRAGRSWQSAADASLTFSLAWKFQRSLQALSGLPLAVGVALARVLADMDVSVQLKWPNDLLQDGHKLAGILIETAADKAPDGHAGPDAVWAVIGIGINLTMPAALAARIERPAAAAQALAMRDRNQLMAALLTGLVGTLQQFEQQGFSAFTVRWNQLHAYAGQAVSILDRTRVLHEGCAVGVDDSGRLLLDTDGGMVAVSAGDVSLRAAAPSETDGRLTKS